MTALAADRCNCSGHRKCLALRSLEGLETFTFTAAAAVFGNCEFTAAMEDRMALLDLAKLCYECRWLS